MKDIQEKRKEIGPFIPGPDDDLLICRCEEVTKGEIRQAVHAGMFTIEEIRRFLRCGMGLCQGQTCGKLVKGIVARELQVSPAEIEPATSRAPMRPTEMRIMAKDGGDDRE
ncbi:(2Fe-2S)-binding protein [Roseburia sp. MUC/MUC-530-WT-4D]|uniref:(2Fe-2S)-binding protein n=1 Tax=Roseburia porci TaxID=2605790 RepID=A0A6L5YRM2_9FIRM|nr:(2Fe-2S)-binding protein [Roseburia porci]MCI5516390.1 (2Fe-2S)-binding protein [Roseburia sp.]MDD6743346.1 (2Fe-2S)-binding protein [Roseburia porci]MST75243.1 (2Fe-2S)-binding protein [Roseburia porci]